MTIYVFAVSKLFHVLHYLVFFSVFFSFDNTGCDMF